ncbi:MAG: leucine-rich repeat domain-containing protein [Paludibacteraceae bacterium]|nr:leucine-rich repeat domain-containing protein [Paludibacteraceae bacterium]
MRKRVFSLFVALGTTLSLLAYDFQSGDLYYTITSSTDPLTVSVAADAGGSYASLTTVTIPETVTNNDVTYSVTGIETNAFSGCTNLTSVVWNAKNCQSWGSYKTAPFHSIAAQITSFTFGEGVELIPYAICDDMTALTNVTLPESTKIIKGSVFYGCTGLTSISIPTNVDTIGLDAFKNCSQLTSVTWNAKNCRPNYYQGALSTPFYAIVSQMTSFTFGDSVECIPDGLMMGMSNISAITIPLHVDSIGGCDAFSGCSSLNSVVWNAKHCKTVKVLNRTYDYEIGEYKYYYDSQSPFYGAAEQITSFTFGDQVESLPDRLCEGMKNLSSILLPDGITAIGERMFYDCYALSAITIPESVQSIGESAFSSCRGLTSITIPNSVKSIGGWAFSGCYGIKKTNFIGTLSEWCQINTGSTPVEYSHNLYLNDVLLTHADIPDGVTTIHDDAFNGDTCLVSITIPNSVTYIGKDAFDGCYNVETVMVGNGVETIDEYAFYDCSALKKFVYESPLAAPLDVISYKADLDTLIAPATVLNTYYMSPSTHVRYIKIHSGEITERGFAALLGSYKTLGTIDLAGASNTGMADRTFYECYNLTQLSLPAQLEAIPYKMIADCYMLQSITIPATVTEIDNNAFENCRSLQTVNFAANNALQRIGNWAFYNCHALQTISIPEGVTYVGDGAFYGCTYLTNITLPSTMLAMGDNSFALCSKLQQMNVRANIPPTIASKTFYNVLRTIPVYVPMDAVAQYKADTYWREFNIIGSDAPSDTENVLTDAATPTRIVRDGKVLVYSNGKWYDMLGNIVE